MPSWINSKKQTYIYQPLSNPNDNININTFSNMQALAYNLVKQHFESPRQEPPLLFIINGFAGTGKSYLISALKSLLQQSCSVTVTTGKASFNINGKTIHSVLNLPVGPRGNKDLKGQSLIRLQDRLHHIKYILIDEYSMLGKTLLGWIDKQCRQATGQQDEIFGGKSIILVGDPAQLPPVADKPLYHTKPSGPIRLIRLSVNQRVQGSDTTQVAFKQLLMLLLSRQPSLVANLNEFDDAIKLFYGNDEVAEYNHQQLLKLSRPVACIQAHHSSSTAKSLPSDEMSGLVPIFISCQAGFSNAYNEFVARGWTMQWSYWKSCRPHICRESLATRFMNSSYG